MGLFPTQINNALTAELAAAKLKIEQLEQKILTDATAANLKISLLVHQRDSIKLKWEELNQSCNCQSQVKWNKI